MNMTVFLAKALKTVSEDAIGLRRGEGAMHLYVWEDGPVRTALTLAEGFFPDNLIFINYLDRKKQRKPSHE